MKNFIRLFVFLTTLAFMTGCSLTRTNVGGTIENRILGLWEVRAIHNSDESGYKETPPGMFKMVFKDGTFMNFMSTEDGAIITVDGSYEIKGDIYTENIVNSFNKSQEGKANHLNFKLSNDNFMYLRWFQPIDEFGVVQNRWIEEIWQRVLIEDLEVSNVDLQQELRSLLYDDELIKKVIK
ncbi:MAG TPA: DUF4488 domain-containing protein [Fermentimonas sp.]|nr:DUF4488 domain-containing protein [Clostridiaceae bacterium]HLW10597.1 DUF4488 domain-containing protein [Fermentimonas sp.]